MITDSMLNSWVNVSYETALPYIIQWKTQCPMILSKCPLYGTFMTLQTLVYESSGEIHCVHTYDC